MSEHEKDIHCILCGSQITKEKLSYVESTKFECLKCDFWFCVDGMGKLSEGLFK